MILISKLLFTGIVLYLFIIYFLKDFDNSKNSLVYKLYLFLFVFVMEFLFTTFTVMMSNDKINLNLIIEKSVNDALISVIAFDVYHDLVYNGFYATYNSQQRTMIATLIIIFFITAVKLLEMLYNSSII